MTTGQMLLYAILLLVVLWYLRRWFLTRGITEYSPAQLADMLKTRRDVILLDVRTATERSSRQIKGSVHIPLHELATREHELTPHRDREIVCYCRSGNRSLFAAARLRRSGFRVAHLRGGLLAWNLS